MDYDAGSNIIVGEKQKAPLRFSAGITARKFGEHSSKQILCLAV